jgi:hypothetical protein
MNVPAIAASLCASSAAHKQACTACQHAEEAAPIGSHRLLQIRILVRWAASGEDSFTLDGDAG